MPQVLTDPKLQLLASVLLGAAGITLLLPRPRGRSVALGSGLSLIGLVIFLVYLQTAFGLPFQQHLGSILFGLFSIVALGAGSILVTQRNPARGAIAFAFVILSVCGLFLMLGAPFLMAATIIIYMGAIIVTFLFVLMLSHVAGPSDENDRSREPLLGTLAGFAFAGLIGLTIYASSQRPDATDAEQQALILPQAPLAEKDRELLKVAIANLDAALAPNSDQPPETRFRAAQELIGNVIGHEDGNLSRKTVSDRLALMKNEPRTGEFLAQTQALRKLVAETDNHFLMNSPPEVTQKSLKNLRDRLYVYSGNGQLPARNIANLGYILYSEHILSVELAGTLLLVATIGAVAITQRRKEGTV